jgi:L-alanine-DL-glutamate epimerase-like enolase superfamily enzyme
VTATLPAPLGDLPLTIDGYTLERREQPVSREFTRVTTVVHLQGGGEEGVGEDVTYSEDDQQAFQDAGPVHGLTGPATLGELSELVGGLDLFPVAPTFPAYRLYRRWAFESAALDLALRQQGLSLAERLELEPQPVRFVVSMRLGEPGSAEPVLRRLAQYPSLEFKLDATSSWTDELVAELAATGAVESVDLKGRYVGTSVDQGADPDLYRRIAEGFPDAWIEDPALTPETEAVLEPHWDRVTWDEPIHSIADLEALPHRPRGVNLKPSRIGSIAALLETQDYCRANDIQPYGGGQFELGPGRGQIQYLASLFHASAPNDVAPRPFNEAELRPGLPVSPLAPAPAQTGFRWGD